MVFYIMIFPATLSWKVVSMKTTLNEKPPLHELAAVRWVPLDWFSSCVTSDGTPLVKPKAEPAKPDLDLGLAMPSW